MSTIEGHLALIFLHFFAEKRRIFISSIFGPTILKISCTRYGTIKDAATVQIIFRERFGRSRLTSSAQKNLADKSETETSVGGNHVSPTRNCVFRPIIDGEYISKCPCCVRRRGGVPQLSYSAYACVRVCVVLNAQRRPGPPLLRRPPSTRLADNHIRKSETVSDAVDDSAVAAAAATAAGAAITMQLKKSGCHGGCEYSPNRCAINIIMQ